MRVRKLMALAVGLCLLAASAVFGQHVLQILPATGSDGAPLSRYRYQHQQPDSLQALQQAHLLLQQLYAEGYLLAHFAALSQSQDTTAVTVAVGPSYQWLSLGPGNVAERQLQLAGYRERFYRQKPFSYTQLSTLMRRLLRQAENSGYPFAQLRLDSLRLTQRALGAALYYQEGPLITFDSLQVSGEVKILHRLLSAHLGIVPGAPYEQRRVDEVVKKLEELPYLKLAESPRISFQNQQARLWLKLKPQPANRLDGVLGLQSKPQGGVLLTGQLDMLLQNPFGRGKTIGVNWQRLREESQQLLLLYRHPYIFKSPLTLALSASLLKEETLFLNRTAGAALQLRQFSDALLSLEYQFKDSRMLDKATGPGLADFRMHTYGMRGLYERLDSRVFPKQGLVLEASVMAGPKEVSRVNEDAGSQPYSRQKLGTGLHLASSLKMQLFLPLANRTTAVLKTAGAFMYDQQLFLPDLYRLGGLQSLRGFREQSLFASRYVLFGAELRQQLGAGSFVFLFYDQGLLAYELASRSYKDSPAGLGAGLSLLMGSGHFNLVYALGHQQNQSFLLRNSQLHFGYTSRF